MRTGARFANHCLRGAHLLRTSTSCTAGPLLTGYMPTVLERIHEVATICVERIRVFLPVEGA